MASKAETAAAPNGQAQATSAALPDAEDPRNMPLWKKWLIVLAGSVSALIV
jgi:hypothetical protein